MKAPSWVVAALAAAFSILVGGSAGAAELACAGPEVPLAAARIEVREGPEGRVWDARYTLEVSAASDFHGGSITFAAPLLPGEEVREAPGVTVRNVAGRVVGMCVAPDAVHGRAIAASFVEPRPVRGVRGPLGAPVARGAAVHVIDAAPGGDSRIDVSGSNLERNVGYVGGRGIGHGAREEARRLTGGPALPFPADTSPIFVRGDDLDADGLVGRVVDARALARTRALGVGAVFIAVVGILVTAARWLERRASVERADALLASEIETAARYRGHVDHPDRS